MKIHYHSDHLGSASFVTNAEGGVMQHLQYLPYGELFVSQRNSEEFDSRYKFTAKELDNETSYTYFGARYYDSDLSSWLSVDPLSDKYPALSPYIYSANNPVVLVDPNGMDWYDFTDENGNYSQLWREGNAATIVVNGDTYQNIGTTNTIRINKNVEITYTQNEATSMTFIGIESDNWESQITNGTNCYEASCQMLNNEGVQTAGRANEVLVTGLGENGRAGNPTANAQNGFKMIDNALEHGDPIIVGVDYQGGSPNYDKMTDHFIVISSKTETLDKGKVTSTTYNYFDPRTSNPDWGTSPTNTLSIQNNKMVGTYNYYYTNKTNQILNYTVTTVRPNLN
jgi:RHS repeat-associated protein